MTKALIRIVPILGSLILFLSWVFQQTLLEEANSTLQRIQAAQTVYQTYQANNAMFNAIMETTDDKEAIKQIRRLQMYNYELGLRDMEMLLDDRAKRNIPKAVDAYGTSRSVEDMMAVLQVRLEKIQEKLATKEEKVVRRKSALNRVFLAVYAVGSATLLVGSVLSVRSSSESS
jgi:DNA-binding transcriptional MerR regulator